MQIQNEMPEPGLESFVNDFIQNRKADLLEIRIALQNNDFDLVKSHAHNWKGFSRPYGFIMLEDLALKLEQLSLQRKLNEVHEVIDQVQKYLDLKSK